jgi:hypothetical protein
VQIIRRRKPGQQAGLRSWRAPGVEGARLSALHRDFAMGLTPMTGAGPRFAEPAQGCPLLTPEGAPAAVSELLAGGS